jgi:hypothetical protein
MHIPHLADAGGAGETPHPIAELSVVRLGKPVQTKEGIVPSGASGTVVHIHDDGRAFIIEFYEPFHAVATVEADAIAA